MNVCKIICDYLISRQGLEIDLCSMVIVDKTLNIQYKFKSFDEMIDYLNNIACYGHEKPMIHEQIVLFECNDMVFLAYDDVNCMHGGILLDDILDVINRFWICKYKVKDNMKCIYNITRR